MNCGVLNAVQLPITMNPRGWSAFFQQGVQGNTIPGVFSSRAAYLAISEVQNVNQNSQYAYDQYEVRIQTILVSSHWLLMRIDIRSVIWFAMEWDFDVGGFHAA